MLDELIDKIRIHLVGSKIVSVEMTGEIIEVRTDAGEFTLRISTDPVEDIIDRIRTRVVGAKIVDVTLVGQAIEVQTEAGEFILRLSPDQAPGAAVGWKG